MRTNYAVQYPKSTEKNGRVSTGSNSVKHPMEISDFLRLVLRMDNPNKIATVDIARGTGVHEDTVYRYLAGDRIPPVEWVVRLSLWLVAEYGDTRVAAHFLPAGAMIKLPCEGECNGRCDDEILNVAELTGDAARNLRESDTKALKATAVKLAHEAEVLHAEAVAKEAAAGNGRMMPL